MLTLFCPCSVLSTSNSFIFNHRSVCEWKSYSKHHDPQHQLFCKKAPVVNFAKLQELLIKDCTVWSKPTVSKHWPALPPTSLGLSALWHHDTHPNDPSTRSLWHPVADAATGHMGGWVRGLTQGSMYEYTHTHTNECSHTNTVLHSKTLDGDE